MIGSGVLIRPERIQVDIGGVARHGGELLPGHEPTASAQRNKFPDPMAVAGNCEGLAVLDGVHDLS